MSRNSFAVGGGALIARENGRGVSRDRLDVSRGIGERDRHVAGGGGERLHGVREIVGEVACHPLAARDRLARLFVLRAAAVALVAWWRRDGAGGCADARQRGREEQR
jgi:hypothetical protein